MCAYGHMGYISIIRFVDGTFAVVVVVLVSFDLIGKRRAINATMSARATERHFVFWCRSYSFNSEKETERNGEKERYTIQHGRNEHTRSEENVHRLVKITNTCMPACDSVYV